MFNKFKNVKSERWLKRYLKFVLVNCVEQYTEKHHILPKSVYPEYNKCSWNLVNLSGRKHFIAHYMLAKAIGENMWYAWHRMNSSNGIKLNSILYEEARIKHSETVSKNMKGKKLKPHTEETKEKLRQARKNQKDPRIGTTHSDKSKKKISDAKKGKNNGLKHFKVNPFILFNKFGKIKYVINESLTSFNKKVDEPILKMRKQKQYKTRLRKFQKYEGDILFSLHNIKFTFR